LKNRAKDEPFFLILSGNNLKQKRQSIRQFLRLLHTFESKNITSCKTRIDRYINKEQLDGWQSVRNIKKIPIASKASLRVG
jgi:hypothetical protein